MTKHSGILIIDDNVVNRDICAMHLEDTQVPLFFAENGYVGLQLAEEKEPDVILLDIMMPEMDGQQLIKTLRGDQQFHDLPIIIMSAVVGINDISNLLKLGATLFLAKPLDRKELQGYLSRCLLSKTCAEPVE